MARDDSAPALSVCRIDRQAWRDRSFRAAFGAADVRVWNDEGADLLAVFADHDEVARPIHQRSERAHAQLADVDARSRRQFEILGKAPVECSGRGRAVRASIHCSASPVRKKPSASKAGGRCLRITPIAGRDVRAAHARFQLVAIGTKQDVDAGERRADTANGRVRACANDVIAGAVSVSPHDDSM